MKEQEQDAEKAGPSNNPDDIIDLFTEDQGQAVHPLPI